MVSESALGYCGSMTTKNEMMSEIKNGMRVRVMNKFGDEIADGFVTEILQNGFQIYSDNQDFHIAWKNVTSCSVTEVKLNVTGQLL